MNSDWDDYRGSGRHEDRLRNPAWLKDFLRHWKLENAGTPPKTTLAILTSLRDLLWQIAETLAKGKTPTGKEIARLNEFMAVSVARRQLVAKQGKFHLELIAPKKDWAWMTAEIAADFAKLLARGEAHRIKICENRDCRWVFYDTSKSQSRRWCADVCSVLMRVRRHRKRRSE